MPECFLHCIQHKIETKYHEQKAKLLLRKKVTIMNGRVSQTGLAALEICREDFPTFSYQCHMIMIRTPRFLNTSIILVVKY